MKNLLVYVFICITLVFTQVNGYERAAAVHSSDAAEELLVSIEDLIFNNNNIFIDLDGIFYPICSLKKENDQWKARIDFGKNAGYCQRGHDLCSKCELCHKSGCPYYVEPCWKKD